MMYLELEGEVLAFPKSHLRILSRFVDAQWEAVQFSWVYDLDANSVRVRAKGDIPSGYLPDNLADRFARSVWSSVSSYHPVSVKVTILTDAGTGSAYTERTYGLPEYQAFMGT